MTGMQTQSKQTDVVKCDFNEKTSLLKVQAAEKEAGKDRVRRHAGK